MRNIIFRGKRTDNGEWVFGFPISFCATLTVEGIETWDGERHPVDSSTVGEYTGLYDKNCKRIFEGDVVSGLFLYALPINGVCVFKDGAFGLEWERGKAKEFTPFTSMCNVQYEVVGNIHDNTELKGAVNDN